jgi:hypothetical protein
MNQPVYNDDVEFVLTDVPTAWHLCRTIAETEYMKLLVKETMPGTEVVAITVRVIGDTVGWMLDVHEEDTGKWLGIVAI